MGSSHREIAQLFAQGETKAKGSRMFIEGNAIFSYGHHFPIAVRVQGENVDFLFNSDGYSSSTSCHKGYVRRALEGCKIREVDTDTIKKAVRGDSSENEVIIIQREPETLTELFNSMEIFLRRAGVKRITPDNKKKLLAQVEKMILVEAL